MAQCPDRGFALYSTCYMLPKKMRPQQVADIHFRRMIRCVVGAPAGICWHDPWHEILHIWNQRVREMVEVCHTKTWAETCASQQWKFAGYIMSLPPERWVRRMLHWQPIGRGPVGRPAMNWTSKFEQFSRIKRWDDWKNVASDDNKKKEKKYTTRVTKPKYWMTALIYFWCISPISCCNTSNQLIQNSTIPVSAAYPEFPGVGFTHTNMHTAQLFFTAGTNSMQTIQHHITQELELRHCTSTTLTQESTDSSRSEGHPTHTVEDHFLQFVMMILVYVVIFVYYLDETYNTTHQRKRGSRYKHKKRRRRHKQTTQKPHTNTKSASYELMPARLCKHRRCKQARLRIYRCKQYFWTRRLLPKYPPYKKNKQSRVHSVTHTVKQHFYNASTDTAWQHAARQARNTPHTGASSRLEQFIKQNILATAGESIHTLHNWRHFIGRRGWITHNEEEKR